MEKNNFERYGLSGNPFRDLSSESLEDVAIFHVVQALDADLQTIRDETLAKENRAIIALVGDLGAGKTERLLLLKKEAEDHGAFCALYSVNAEKEAIMNGFIGSILEQAAVGKKNGLLSPKWQRAIKRVRNMNDPDAIGDAVAKALNENAPSFLLINDLHCLPNMNDVDLFLKTVYAISNKLFPGVLIVLSGDDVCFEELMVSHPALFQRINRKLVIPPLDPREAGLVLAKRLLAKRLVDDLDPLYPFTMGAVEVLNDGARGNPRALLKLADQVMEAAARSRAVQIDEAIVVETLDRCGASFVVQEIGGGMSEISSCPTVPKR